MHRISINATQNGIINSCPYPLAFTACLPNLTCIQRLCRIPIKKTSLFYPSCSIFQIKIVIISFLTFAFFSCPSFFWDSLSSTLIPLPTSHHLSVCLSHFDMSYLCASFSNRFSLPFQ